MRIFTVICFLTLAVGLNGKESTTRDQLRSVTISSFHITDKTLPEILTELSRASKKAHPAGKGIVFAPSDGHFLIFNPHAAELPTPITDKGLNNEPQPGLGLILGKRKTVEGKRITLPSGKTTLWDLLDKVCAVHGHDYAIRPGNRVYVFKKPIKRYPIDLRCYSLKPKEHGRFGSPDAIALALRNAGVDLHKNSNTKTIVRVHKPSGRLVVKLPTNELHALEKRYALEPVLAETTAKSVTAKTALWQFMFARLNRVAIKNRNVSQVMLDLKRMHGKEHAKVPPLDFCVSRGWRDGLTPWNCDLHGVSAMDVVNSKPSSAWGFIGTVIAGSSEMSVLCEARIPISPKIFGKGRDKPTFTAQAWFESYGIPFGISPSGRNYTVKWDRETNHLYLYLQSRDAYQLVKLISLLDTDR